MLGGCQLQVETGPVQVRQQQEVRQVQQRLLLPLAVVVVLDRVGQRRAAKSPLRIGML